MKIMNNDTIMIVLLIYLVLVSIVGFVLFGTDKALAKGGKRRIPERTLFTVAALGGASGCLVGMFVFRHKTKHSSFLIGIPLLLLLNIVLSAGIWWLFIR